MSSDPGVSIDRAASSPSAAAAAMAARLAGGADAGWSPPAAAAAMAARLAGGADAARAWELVRAGGRNHVWRAHGVIVKELRGNVERGFNDWASLQLLGEQAAMAGVAPRLLGGDRDARAFAMADLGGSRSLDDLLRGTDRDAALRALVRHGEARARMHAATRGAEPRWLAIRAAFPGADTIPDRRRQAAEWLAGEAALHAWLAAAGCDAPEGLAAAMRRVAEGYAEPGEWLAFTHGDPAPTNCHLAADGTLRLLDFEYGGFRHALYDETAWEMLCPLPAPAVAALAAAYRAALARTVPGARDAAAFAAAWADLCAYRGLAVLSWIPRDVLDANRPWVEDWSCREALLCTLGRLARVAEPHAELAPIGGAARRLHAALHARWPEYPADPAPRFPALGA